VYFYASQFHFYDLYYDCLVFMMIFSKSAFIFSRFIFIIKE
jgi:hypothetical protein